MLLFKMIKNGINGKFYSSFKSLITNTQSCVKLNGILSDWFPTISGVRQGDTSSSTVFALYINDLIEGINGLDKGIKCGNNQSSCLVYADDIILLSESENDMQTMLDFTNDWCNKWRLGINHSKSNCMHFRNKGKSRSKYLFKVKGYVLEYTDTYKYLGIFINDFLDFSYTADTLAQAGSRALGSVIQKIHSKKDIGFKTYKKLYESCVIPVIDYCSSSWGFKEYKLEALERLYRSTGLIFLQWQKKFLTIIIQSLHFSSLKKKGMEKTCEKRRKKW